MSLRKGVGIVACLIGIAVAGCGGGGDGSNTTLQHASAPVHSTTQSRDPSGMIGRAQMVGSPDTGVQSSTMARVTNGWAAHTDHRQTLVAAGVEARTFHPHRLTTGLFSISRLRLHPFDQSGDLVEVPGAGTLTITKAPLGHGRVALSAQKRGNIEFTSTNGITGTLHLSDDTVTLNP
jgi:hypothetical protein